jgi:ABC-type transport system substrate-binding protein
MKKSSIISLGLLLFGMLFLVPTVTSPTVVTAVTAAPAVDKFAVELWFDNSEHYGATEDDVALMVESQLEATGHFDVTVKSTDWTTYKAQRNAGTMPAFLLGWWFDYPDESNYIDPFVEPGAFFPGALNSTAMKGYVRTMSESSDPAERATAQKAAQKLMAEEANVIPLFTMTNQFIAYGSTMTGVVLEPSESLHYASMKKGSTVGPITIGTTDSIPTLDFADAYSFFASNTLFQTSHGLFELPIESTLAENVVANSYTISDDGLKYTMNISTELKFTDGSSLTVEDVMWSLGRSTSLSGEPSGLVGSIDNTTFTKVNNTAFSFNLTQKDGILLQKMTYSNSYVWKMNSTVTNAIQGQTYIPVGLGPYYIDSWIPNEELVYKVSPYYDETILDSQVPQNSQVTIKFKTTSTTLRTDIETGAVDVAFHYFTSDEITALEGNTALKTDTKDTAGIRYLIINVDTYSDKSVRQAMAYSFDRAEFVSTIFDGKNAELYSMVSPIFSNACVKGDDCAFSGQNLPKVTELMNAYFSVPDTSSAPGSSSNGAGAPGFEAVAIVASLTFVSIIYTRKKRNN